MRLKFIGYGIVLKKYFDAKFPDLGQGVYRFFINLEKISFKKYALFLFAFFLLLACLEPCIGADQIKGLYHLVKKNETLKDISAFYHIEVQKLVKANKIKNPDFIEAGSVIFIPGVPRFPKKKSIISTPLKLPVNEPVKYEVVPKSKTIDSKYNPKTHEKETNASISLNKNDLNETQKSPNDQLTAIELVNKEDLVSQTTPETTIVSGTTSIKIESTTSINQARDVGKSKGKKVKADQVRFRWPVKGKITRRFGIQPNGMYYNGITIVAKEKIPVLAAAGGRVIFSSLMKDYGETIIIKHEGDYATVYTNLGIRIAVVDDQVKRGDQLGFLGKSEKKGKSYLGFEIRHKNRAVDPLSFLP